MSWWQYFGQGVEFLELDGGVVGSAGGGEGEEEREVSLMLFG